ncbi:MAG: efflux RND transporter periplasmic adaptor subunit [Polyangiaceae bacterium]
MRRGAGWARGGAVRAIERRGRGFARAAIVGLAIVGLAIVGVVLALAGCSGGAERGAGSGETSRGSMEEGHRDEAAHEAMPTRVRLSAQAIADARLRTAKVVRRALSPTLSLVGEIAADPDRLARVAAPADGRIESLSFKEGQRVEKGEVLAVVRVPELGKVRGALAAASAKAKAARANADRLAALLEKRLASAQEVENAKAEASAYEAEARALSAELSAMGTGGGGGASLTLRAPIAGVVIARDAVLGQPVTQESVLATIGELSSVWFLARVFEKDLGRLRVGAKVEVELNAYPKEHLPGVLEYISKQVDPVARTVTARVVLANPEGRLGLGLFGTARVSVGEGTARPERLVIERAAVTEVAGRTAVFVRHPDDDFELHEVQVGEGAEGLVEVLSGLREGEDVVVDGAFTLKSVLLKGTIAEED